MLVGRAKRAWRHLMRGTLLDRLLELWNKCDMQRRGQWWDTHAERQTYVETRLERSIRVRLYYDSQLSKKIYAGAFERRERQFLRRFLKSGDVCVDVGAHIGVYTLLTASLVGAAGRVYAFEPCTATYRRLRENMALNHFGHVQSYPLALSDSASQMAMTVSRDGYDAWNSLGHPIAGEHFASEMITTVRWDDFAREHDLVGRVTLMKIDVEGWETRVLQGGWDTLARADAPTLMVEFTELAAQSAGSSCGLLYTTLEALGYRLFTYDPWSKTLRSDPRRDAYPYLNLIATKHPDDSQRRLR